MIYRKNIPGWERALRVAAGGCLIAFGLIGLEGMPVGYVVACVGFFTSVTGFFGFCPACAFAGRRLR
jgi:hypothetical protein